MEAILDHNRSNGSTISYACCFVSWNREFQNVRSSGLSSLGGGPGSTTELTSINLKRGGF